MLSWGLLRSVIISVKTQPLLNELAVLSDLCRILAFHWEVGSNRYRRVHNFPSFRWCSWCLSDFTEKKPYCFSTANLSQAAASKNWLVSMPLLRYLRAAAELPKDGANFSWQHNAIPDGCSSRQRWNYSPDRTANKPIASSESTVKKLSSSCPPAMQFESCGTEVTENKTTLATCTPPLPFFQWPQQISKWTWRLSRTGKKLFLKMIL